MEMSVRHLEKDKQQLSGQLARKEQESLHKSVPPLAKSHQKNSDMEEKEKILIERERNVHDRERRAK